MLSFFTKKETVSKVTLNVILILAKESAKLKNRCFDYAQHDKMD